jgi:uncharacterized repeat protein (TIGR01451 family)
MKANHVLLIAIALLLAAPLSAWSQSKGHIRLQSQALVEQEVMNAEGKKVIERVPAAKVVPGTEVIFSQRYENIGHESAENAVITNPIPEHMLYKSGSAVGEGAQIMFSVDHGKSYNIPGKLFVFDAAGRKFPARPKDYTHVRWTFTTPLPSGAKGEVSFRAILE